MENRGRIKDSQWKAGLPNVTSVLSQMGIWFFCWNVEANVGNILFLTKWAHNFPESFQVTVF